MPSTPQYPAASPAETAPPQPALQGATAWLEALPPPAQPAPQELPVRPATLDDLPALAPLFNQYRMFYWQADDAVLAHGYLEERLRLQDSVIFVAADGPALAGFVQLYPTFSSVSARRAWILNDLFVAPDWRQRGVAKALMQRALDHGRASGAAWMSLQTAHDNLPAQALYRSFGFVPDEYYLSLSHAF